MEKFKIDFGSIIAYIIPGFVGLYSLSPYSNIINNLLGKETFVPSIAAIIPILIFAIGIGIFLNAVVWMFLRPILHCTCINVPDFNKLNLNSESLETYKEIINSTFRYYQFYSNTFISLLMLFISYVHISYVDGKFADKVISFNMVILIFVLFIFFLAARNTLKETYKNISKLMLEEKK